ncbi:hypothetical protein [Deinococcus sp.]|uniref:hypothetical protein n=1 Tax=Deinococcus sp. TaxID=47478 RepID=UPI003C7AB8B4
MPSDDAPGEVVDRFVEVTDTLPAPESAEEIGVIVRAFPQHGDTFHGLAWTLLHCLEASPLWPTVAERYRQQAYTPEDEWMDTLLRRLANASQA